MKFRHIFVVTRNFSGRSVEKEKENFGALKDEGGEFLYGGDGGSEKLDVRLEVFDEKSESWQVVDSKERI
jgi:hypothetical protein